MTGFGPGELDPVHDVVDFLDLDDAVNLTTCDREPIHVPGSVQPHGVLLAVDADLVVVRVSANTYRYLGLAPEQVLAAPLTRALGADPVQHLRAALANPRASGSDPLVVHPRGGVPLELTWHRGDGLVLVELEPALDARALSVAALFADVRHAMDTLQGTAEVAALCAAAATEIAHITGFARVMVYRFHPDGHGEVVAEQRREDLEPFLGLHYPASDIPRQARKLYLLNHLRVIPDVRYTPVPLLGRDGADPADARTLDLSLAGLRSVSPMHLAYLANMGVRATLTISLMEGTRLWGMVACHHDSPRRVGAQVRAACRVLGQVFSLQVVAQEERNRQASRVRLAAVENAVLVRMSGAESLATALSQGSPSPLELTSADGMVARIDGETVAVGSVPPPEAVEALLARLCAPEEPGELVCDDLPLRFPELARWASTAAGVLAVPLSAGYQDFVLWLRGEDVREQMWGGDPDKPVVGDPTAAPGEAQPVALGPRESFAAWAQQVRGLSRPWQTAEVETGRALAAAVPDLLLARARDRLAHLALHDTVTGLPNRVLLLERTAEALDRTGDVALLFVDLDHFKLVNDSRGHAAGDHLLRQAAHRLAAASGPSDTVARLGGDEFVVLCPRTSGPEAVALAHRLVRDFRVPFALGGHTAVVTASVGLAVATARTTTTAAELLHDADSAMYRVKHSGRDGVAAFTVALRTQAVRRTEIQAGLRPALERGELRLHYQPVHTTAGHLVGFEALSRWPQPSGAAVPPNEFIPVAESLGMIGALTAWALEEGLAALAGWRHARPDLDLTLAVNISPVQMVDDSVRRMVDGALERHGLPGRALCLEITESALLGDTGVNHRFLGGLREEGVRLSIDDFGTGYSSLAYLTKLPVQELKIDRAFIAGLSAGGSDAVVVASVVELAHQLGLEALAEGVETDEQLAAVRRLGCDRVQGYLLGVPVPADEVARLLRGVPLAE